MRATVSAVSPSMVYSDTPVIHTATPSGPNSLKCPNWAIKMTIAKPFTKPNITGYGTIRINLPSLNRAKMVCKIPINTTVAKRNSTPCSTTRATITTANAPVAPEIIPGLPPNTAVIRHTIIAA